MFVKMGTKAKYYSLIYDSTATFELSRGRWKEMLAWIEEVEEALISDLECELIGQDYPDVSECVLNAMQIVFDNNDLKGSETVDGKIIKNADHVDPVIKIGDYLNGY